MTVFTQVSPRQLFVGFAAGMVLMGVLSLSGAAVAQTAPPSTMPDVATMVEWCRQMMSQTGSMMQGMMGGMCMMGR